MESRVFCVLYLILLMCWTSIIAANTTDDSPGKRFNDEGGPSADLRVGLVARGRAFQLVSKVVKNVISGLSDPTDEIISQLGEIKNDLKAINELLQNTLKAVKFSLEYLKHKFDEVRLLTLFSDDLKRLQYFIESSRSILKFDRTNQIIITTKTSKWAEEVLSLDTGSMKYVLYNINGMITGSLVTKPIRDVYMRGLQLLEDRSIWTKMDQLLQTIDNMQYMGYSLWAIALDILKQSNEKKDVEKLAVKRHKEQESFVSVDRRFKYWPQGQYGLVQTSKGCPGGYWKTGYRYHDTEDKNAANWWSPSNLNTYIKGSFAANNMRWEFCMTSVRYNAINWPKGRYCVFAASGTCPTGFRMGWIYFDDEDKNNANKKYGSVPYGRYDGNTMYYFCCRGDGDNRVEMRLPITHPFVLFPLDKYACPRVHSMKVKELKFHWDCEDKNNGNKRGQPHPWEEDQGKNMRIKMCYYMI